MADPKLYVAQEQSELEAHKQVSGLTQERSSLLSQMPCNFDSLDVKRRLAALAKSDMHGPSILPLSSLNLKHLNQRSPNAQQTSLRTSHR